MHAISLIATPKSASNGCVYPSERLEFFGALALYLLKQLYLCAFLLNICYTQHLAGLLERIL